MSLNAGGWVQLFISSRSFFLSICYSILRPKRQCEKAAPATGKRQSGHRLEGDGLLGNLLLDKQIFSSQMFISYRFPKKDLDGTGKYYAANECFPPSMHQYMVRSDSDT